MVHRKQSSLRARQKGRPMTKFFTMNDHDNAMMLIAHWATPETEKLALSSFAGRITQNERPDAEDVAVFENRLREWERNARTTYYVADEAKQPISEDFDDEAAARAHKAEIGGAKLMWRQSYPQPQA